jgi:hypothetical protein
MFKNIQFISQPFEDCYERGYSYPGWYFWDETQADCIGPFTTLSRATIELTRYCRWLNSKEQK